MDVQQRLDEIVATVDGARSMPMSASCVVNRAELLAMLEEVRAALPGSLAQAQELLGGREQMVAEAQQEAQRIIEGARAERGSLVAGTEIARQAQQESDRILAEARSEAEEIRAEADDYVDSKLANFEVVLSKTIGSVERGREKLLGGAQGGYDDADDDAPERTADPEELRHRADEYVNARLGSVAAVLTKTLEAVGRGRQKLLGHRPVDELGAHLAAQDLGGDQAPHTSDADYLAGLADVPAQASPAAAVPPQAPDAMPPGTVPPGAVPQQPADPYAQPAAAGQDPYGQGAYYDAGQGAGYPQDAYYGAQQPGYGAQQYGGQPAAALDETSFFDTGMIDLDQVARYEQQYTAGQYQQDGGYPPQYGQEQDPAYRDGGTYQGDHGYPQDYGQSYDPGPYGPGGDGRG
ncbi:cell division initiation protein [Streptomyces sp. RKND-216]|uniref:ATP synthase F0 subunit B n=1 Tax=Streptomyces sp. RKND-216 TaxID=2562581 RepID=UPI0032B35462